MRDELMTGSIICGVDDSESAKCAARVARGLSSRLEFVRAVDPGSAGSTRVVQTDPDPAERGVRREIVAR
jgi:hypothetical protein